MIVICPLTPARRVSVAPRQPAILAPRHHLAHQFLLSPRPLLVRRSSVLFLSGEERADPSTTDLYLPPRADVPPPWGACCCVQYPRLAPHAGADVGRWRQRWSGQVRWAGRSFGLLGYSRHRSPPPWPGNRPPSLGSWRTVTRTSDQDATMLVEGLQPRRL